MSKTLKAAALMGPSVLYLGLAMSQLMAYPGDVFQTGAPAAPKDAGASQQVSVGKEHDVSSSGAAEYALPIALPPGRNGLVPSLALTYSSRNPIRGGVAVGWSMGVPSIAVDTSDGRIDGPNYISSLTGTRLVQVFDDPAGAAAGETVYRAERDGSYARYVYGPDERGEGVGMWRVHTSDGRTYYFGESSSARDEGSTGAPLDPPYWFAEHGRWMLTRVADEFGNEIDYSYEKTMAEHWEGVSSPVDLTLKTIEYGSNPGAGLTHSVRVNLVHAANLALCAPSKVPIGASFSYRNGFVTYAGAERLDSIVVEVMDTQSQWQERRRVDLAYDAEAARCPGQDPTSGLFKVAAPLRILTSITEKAVGTDGVQTEMPAVTFGYGPYERTLSVDKAVDAALFGGVGGRVARGHQQLSHEKAGGWPSLSSMLLDLDGDGVLDLLEADDGNSASPTCEATFRRNIRTGSEVQGSPLPPPTTIAPSLGFGLPTSPWANADASNLLGTRMWDTTDPALREGCSLASQYTLRTTSVGSTDQCGVPGNYTGYRFMDWDNDGLPDLVTSYDYQQGRYRPSADGQWQGRRPRRNRLAWVAVGNPRQRVRFRVV